MLFKKRILHDLYNGNIIPWERHGSHSEKYNELLSKIEEEERYFISKMSLDDCERFQELSQLHMELSTSEEDNLFSYAFTIGVLLAMDIIKETEEIYND
ncbi:hypothetical protein GCM10023142_23270 [Anaerocolumna aminovalerica]|uniref:Uncharacterized protein n=1 Tax=Anaerocolumna aminovalerica TaxID=1527 RepID=A0A1I5GJ98_9FIRM|nr:DUF6809 family protein [Anaerocolumna aminovalerica]MBU5334396.1 hypothetical protein [Anaerocolumna aminovalerica]SFO36068.1 hypothetical protein SAMN04489757_12012 [Anaerocolumna aminovalerica]